MSKLALIGLLIFLVVLAAGAIDSSLTSSHTAPPLKAAR